MFFRGTNNKSIDFFILAFVFWYHNDRMINYDSVGRGEISIHKDPAKGDSVVSTCEYTSCAIIPQNTRFVIAKSNLLFPSFCVLFLMCLLLFIT